MWLPEQSADKFKLDLIKEFFGEDTAGLHRMINTSYTQLGESLNTMKVACLTRQTSQVKKVAHNLKTIFRYFGFGQTAQLLEIIEQNANEQTLPSEAAMQSVETAIHSLRIAIRTHFTDQLPD
jgi:HPt (histidine-containing phosphotransfer) domain-containing protein